MTRSMPLREMAGKLFFKKMVSANSKKNGASLQLELALLNTVESSLVTILGMLRNHQGFFRIKQRIRMFNGFESSGEL